MNDSIQLRSQKLIKSSSSAPVIHQLKHNSGCDKICYLLDIVKMVAIQSA